MAARLARTGRVTVTSPVRVFDATPVLGESTWAALHDAKAWVVEHDPR
jgi:SulP family sulfate permease